MDSIKVFDKYKSGLTVLDELFLDNSLSRPLYYILNLIGDIYNYI